MERWSSTAPTTSKAGATPYASAMEHLVDYVDKTLTALQTGIGLKGEIPFPITHDIARRLLWTEIRRTIYNLAEDVGTGVDADVLNTYLWLRVQGPAPGELAASALILQSMITLDNGRRVDSEDHKPYRWTFRTIGPRKPEDSAVSYVVCHPVESPEEALHILETFQRNGLQIRDYNLGPST